MILFALSKFSSRLLQQSRKSDPRPFLEFTDFVYIHTPLPCTRPLGMLSSSALEMGEQTSTNTYTHTNRFQSKHKINEHIQKNHRAICAHSKNSRRFFFCQNFNTQNRSTVTICRHFFKYRSICCRKPSTMPSSHHSMQHICLVVHKTNGV